MSRNIDDQDYLDFLPTELHRRRYYRWKEKMLREIDAIIADLETTPVEHVMEKRDLSPKDIALLVRLGYVTDEQAERFDMLRIEALVP